MPTVKDVDPNLLIAAAAAELAKNEHCKPPAWAAFTKTGTSRQRPPAQKDWWYLRSASMLQKLATGKPIGVSRLRTVYGGRKNRGHKPERQRDASGKIIRTVFQQLEAAGYVKTEKGKGRVLTKDGRAVLKTAIQLATKA
ncbi:MAG: 30S ribosomal protein S19e [Nanoarchaeota archaeon]|nr:30S ribosomal protein S19e [Nanoarchaeota archaeon]